MAADDPLIPNKVGEYLEFAEENPHLRMAVVRDLYWKLLKHSELCEEMARMLTQEQLDSVYKEASQPIPTRGSIGTP